MPSAKIIILALMALLIIVHHGEAWRRRRRRRCPLRDCQVSSWSHWSSCSVSQCGQQGSQSRSRTEESSSSCGGAPCPDLYETRQCYGATPVHCQMSSWSYWSSCSASQCVEHGSQSRSRTEESPPSCGGAPCPDLYETRHCYGTTPVDCQLSSWSEWSACTTPCGVSGTQSSSRHRITAELCGGRCASTFLQTRACPDLSCLNGGSLKDGTCFCKESYAGDCCETGAQKSPLSAWTIVGWCCLGVGVPLLIVFLRAAYVKLKTPERRWLDIICKCECKIDNRNTNINNGVVVNGNINNGGAVNANINNREEVNNDKPPRPKKAW